MKSSSSTNIFDNLPALSAPQPTELQDELERYLSIDPEDVSEPLLWWFERKHIYPHLSRMALDYLSIPRMFELYPFNFSLIIFFHNVSYLRRC